MKQFVFSLLFKGDASGARRATADVKEELDGVAGAAQKSQAALKGNAAELEREAQAARKAADANRDLATAEKQARDALAKAQGVAPVSLGPERVQALREKYVPLEAVQRSYAKNLEDIALAERTGALTAAESAAAKTRLTASHHAEVEALRRSTDAHDKSNRVIKLAAHERRNLMMQVNDTTQSLALGMPPLQVLLQQGPQITQIYGGIGNTFRAMGQAATVGRLAVGGLASVLLIGATSWNGYLRSVKEVDTAAAGLGRGMALTRQEMEASARAGAAAAGISVKAARSMQAAFLRTGRIDGSNFDGLVGLSKDFAATIGADADAAGQALSEIFSDPVKGADILFRQFGLIDAATARLAQDLAAQNRLSEAQAVLLKALPGSLASAEEAATALGRAMEFVGRKASDAGDAIGAAINWVFDGPTIEEQLKELRRQIDNGDDYTPYGLMYRYTDTGASTEEQYRALYEDKARRDRSEQHSRRMAQDRRLSAPAIAIAEASPVNAALMRERELRNQIATLQSGQGVTGNSAEQEAENARAIEAKTRALDGLLNKQMYQNTLDQIGLQLATERNPLRRAELVLMQTLFGSADKEITLAQASAEALSARNQVMREAMGTARAQSAEIATELEIRTRLNAQQAQGLITAEEANRLLREELDLHPLVAAAAEANGQEQRDLNEIIAERRRLTAELAASEKEAAITDRVNSWYKSRAEDLAGLRLEAALIGVTDRERQKALAAFEAENEARAIGLDLGSDRAIQMRDEAVALADYRSEVERLADAWGTVEDAVGSAIDGAIDHLLDGDLSDAAKAIGREILGLFTELGLKNPLKNALLGTDLPTMNEVGGLSGIWARLTGERQSGGNLTVSSMNAASMTVTTPMVQINAGAFGGQTPGSTAMPGYVGAGGGPLPGPGNVQGQVWQFFAQKGLAPHQIAAIMGNVSAESGFNPLAVGDAGQAFGLFQHNDRKHKLFDFIGGQQNLGNVQAQLEFVWQELMTTENQAFKRLMSSGNLYDATHAFVGFERPQGYNINNPSSAMHWDKRLAGAEAAMAQFEGATVSAQAQLGQLGTGAAQLGTGLQNFGAGLAGTLEGIGASYGPGGQFLGGLLGAGVKWLTGGFQGGGYTGPGATTDVAGVVHAEEYVFDAAATRRIGVANLEALRRGSLRGYREGGYVVGGRPALPARAADIGGAGAGGRGQPIEMNLNISGTGSSEIREAVETAIRVSLERYDRDVMPGRVRAVVKDRWTD